MDANISSWRVFERLDSSEADDLHLGYENAYKFVQSIDLIGELKVIISASVDK